MTVPTLLRRWRRLSAAASAGVLAATPLLGLPTAAAAGPARSPIAAGRASAVARVTSAPRLPVGARSLGAVDPGALEQGAVVLQPREEAALQGFLAGLTNRRSPHYHHYLPAGAFGARFGPTSATIAAVGGWLRSDGLRVTSVAADGLLVDFAGSAGSVERAFATGLQRYRLPDGTTGQATTTAISAPASLAGVVAAVVGLDDLARPQPQHIYTARTNISAHHVSRPSFAHPAGSPAACPDASSDALSAGGLTDDQIAHSYGASSLYTAGDLGAGQTIAVFELEPLARSDVVTFDTCFFGATQAQTMQGRLTIGGAYAVDGGLPAGPGSGEGILDVEDVSAIAPAATLDVYEAPNTSFGGLDEWSRIVNDDAASIVTTSWGLCEQAVQLGEPGQQQAENLLFEQAAAQGQSIFAAEGDTGDDACNAFRGPPPPEQNLLSLLDPASQPYVISVGGTTITAATQPPTERVWNDGGPGGSGGGGISESWAMSSWQRNLLASDPANATDVAAAESVEDGIGQSANGPSGTFATPTFCAPSGTAAGATYCRETPDVAAQADEETSAVTIYSSMFVALCACDGWVTIGGTSSATPIWAALLALAAASSSCTASGHALGFVSPILYGIAASGPQDAASFSDVTVGNNDIYGFDEGLVFPARAGYDMASGLGSPRLAGASGSAGLAYYACAAAATSPARPTVTSLAPPVLSTAGSTATSTPVTIHGTGFESGGTPDVADIEVGTFTIPPTAFTVTGPETISAEIPPAADTVPTGAPAPQDGAGPADIVVTLTDAQSSAPGAASVLQYVDESPSAAGVPSVTGVSPFAGSEAGPCPTRVPARCITILGSDFASATGVSFGGVPAASFAVVAGHASYEIVATPPPFATSGSGAEQCSPLPSGSGLTSTNDICQVQVQVANAAGSSAPGKILPPYEGATLAPSPMGPPGPPAGCGCELIAGPTEFDYAPTPTITGVSTVLGPTFADAQSLASEFVFPPIAPGTLVTVTGAGFDPQTLMWTDLGDPTLESSMDGQIVYADGTTFQFVANGLPPIPNGQIPFSVDPVAVPLRVVSLAGTSTPTNIWYAGIPDVTSVRDTANLRLVGGLPGAPATGGAPLSITGAGFADQLGIVVFQDTAGGPSYGEQRSFTPSGDTSLATETVYQPPATVFVLVCTVTACGGSSSAAKLVLYEPSAPVVDAIAPSSGPGSGGTAVTISGQDLGCVTGVFFGGVKAASFGNVSTPHGLDCGSTGLVQAVAPPGVARSRVPVRVTTVESDYSGSGPSTTTATFTYTPSAPSAPVGFAGTPGPGSASLRWSPPANDGGSPVTRYVLTASPGSGGTTVTLPASARSYVFSDLEPGFWAFSLSAVSALGVGPAAVVGSLFGGFYVPPGDNGYAVATANGAVFSFGSLPPVYGPGGGRLSSPIVGLTVGNFGWFAAAADGTVYGLNSTSLGSASLSAGTRIVGIATTVDGNGYWLVADDGAVYGFGDAHYRGGVSGVRDVVGIAADPFGLGYYVAEADGAVHAFGAATSQGDLAGRHLSKPVVAIAVNPVTGGYWLLGGDGGVFSFGRAGFCGSMVGRHLNAGAVGIVGTPDGKGYWLVAADNGIFSFGAARYVGNPMRVAESPAVSITTF